MSSVGGSSGSGRSGSSSSASRSSSTNSVSRSATTTKTAAQTRGLGHAVKDTFAAAKLPQCEVTKVKGNQGKSGTGVTNDVCTFDRPDTAEA